MSPSVGCLRLEARGFIVSLLLEGMLNTDLIVWFTILSLFDHEEVGKLHEHSRHPLQNMTPLDIAPFRTDRRTWRNRWSLRRCTLEATV